MKTLVAFALVFLAAIAFGQASPVRKADPAKASAPPAGITVSDPIYPFPVEERVKVRDLQVEFDELEIDNQKMLLKVEQNRQRQAQLLDSIKVTAYQFSQLKHINLELYELDPKEVKFVRKKATK